VSMENVQKQKRIGWNGKSYAEGVVAGQQREYRRQSAAMQKTVALTSTTKADIVRSLATYAKVVKPPTGRSSIPRRLGTLAQVSSILPDMLQSSRFSSQAYILDENMGIAPLRGLKVLVFVGDTLVWSKQVFTATCNCVTLEDLYNFLPDRELTIPMEMFRAVCKSLTNMSGLELVDAQVHHRRDASLFIRACLQSEGARDKIVRLLRNTATTDPRAKNWRLWSRSPQVFVKKVFSSVADGVVSLLAGSPSFSLLGGVAEDVILVDLILLLWADNCQKITAVKMRLVDLSGNIFPGHLTKVESILEIIGEEAHLPPFVPRVIASVQEAVKRDYFNNAHSGVL
jgi:hypothetical protein